MRISKTGGDIEVLLNVIRDVKYLNILMNID